MSAVSMTTPQTPNSTSSILQVRPGVFSALAPSHVVAPEVGRAEAGRARALHPGDPSDRVRHHQPCSTRAEEMLLQQSNISARPEAAREADTDGGTATVHKTVSCVLKATALLAPARAHAHARACVCVCDGER